MIMAVVMICYAGWPSVGICLLCTLLFFVTLAGSKRQSWLLDSHFS